MADPDLANKIKTMVEKHNQAIRELEEKIEELEEKLDRDQNFGFIA